MIDFTNPDVLMHNGEAIPINTVEKYETVRGAAGAVYAASGRLWDDDAEGQLERRVLNGFDAERILSETLRDRKARFDEA
jgi:hypothetical protein